MALLPDILVTDPARGAFSLGQFPRVHRVRRTRQVSRRWLIALLPRRDIPDEIRLPILSLVTTLAATTFSGGTRVHVPS